MYLEMGMFLMSICYANESGPKFLLSANEWPENPNAGGQQNRLNSAEMTKIVKMKILRIKQIISNCTKK